VMQGGMRGARTKASVVEQRLGGRLRVDGYAALIQCWGGVGR
jgi:hypothetical protein